VGVWEKGDGVENDVGDGVEEAETEASEVDELGQVRHVVEGQPPESLNVVVDEEVAESLLSGG
jgi:hypothetical protein